jgi:small subunit ribosomal protein S12
MRIYQTYRKNKRGKRYRRSSVPAFKGKHPFKRASIRKVRIMKPKKPNSANRKITKVKLCNDRYINCYIPGQGHSLQLFGTVIVRGGRVKDLPGIRYHLVRGVKDFAFKENIARCRRKSKYGYPTKGNKKIRR